MSIKSVEQLDIKGKRVFIRVDFNVPVKNGKVNDDTRITAALDTIKYALGKGAKVILASHMGKPDKVLKKGTPEAEMKAALTLKTVADYINEKGFFKVKFVDDCVGAKVKSAVDALHEGEAILLENLRFHKGETAKEEDAAFVGGLAELCDVYVNDAFGTCHRKHASTYYLATKKSEKGAGYLVQKEAKYFDQILNNPQKPYVAIVGGAKVSEKIGVIKSLVKRVDKVIIGGAMAYTFLKQEGHTVGTSLVEEDKLDICKEVREDAKKRGVELLLPVDHLASKEFDGEPVPVAGVDIPDGMMGLDIGPKSTELFANAIKGAKMVLWNGPMGVFESEKYNKGTFKIADAVAALGKDAITVVGGGDSVSAVNKAGISSKISHISTGGGASLEYIEFGSLPGIDILR